MSPLMNGKQKITVGAVIGILTLVGTIFGGSWALDYRYASKERVSTGFENILDAIVNMKCATIREELNTIVLREQHDEMTPYDQARKNNLRLRWQRECLSGSGG